MADIDHFVSKSVNRGFWKTSVYSIPLRLAYKYYPQFSKKSAVESGRGIAYKYGYKKRVCH